MFPSALTNEVNATNSMPLWSITFANGAANDQKLTIISQNQVRVAGHEATIQQFPF
jgi:hypothetical protein